MKRVVLACLLLAGCAQRMELQTEPIALLYAAEEASKTDALSEGDEVTVFASVEGTQNYFLNGHKFVVGSDGRTLTTQPAVFYPDPKQAVTFWAYFGSQSVPSDQSTAAALKQADLCWATASSTPSHAAVPLTFRHVFARLTVTCSQPTSKITAVNACSGGTLDIRTGSFANTTRSDVSTTGNELIVPAQTLNRLVVTSNGVDYVFDGSIALESGKATTANLTLNPSTKTASLSGSSVSAWAAQTGGGNLSEAVSNVLTLHWPNFIQQGALPDKVVFTINGSDYTVSSGITYADKTFTVPFASSVLVYPYEIQRIVFSASAATIQACTQLVGSTIYKSGVLVVGVRDPIFAVKIGSLWWATGNLVADGSNGCRIGAPTDAGLHFAFGSLVGWSGGATGDGRGRGTPSKTKIAAKPSSYIGLSTYPGGYYSSAPSGTGYCYPSTDNSSTGVGDPCRYYLGPSWRTPTYVELRTIPAKFPSSGGTLSNFDFSYVSGTPDYIRRNGSPEFILPLGANSIVQGSVYSQSMLAVSSRTSDDLGYFFTQNSTQISWGGSNSPGGEWYISNKSLPHRCVATTL